MLYCPGLSPSFANTTIFTREDGHWRAYFVLEFSGMQKDDFGWYTPLKLRCFHLDHDGAAIARRYVELEVPPFVGEVEVTTLKYIPSGYLPKEDEVREKLVQRGKAYVKACNEFYVWSIVGANDHALLTYINNIFREKTGWLLINKHGRNQIKKNLESRSIARIQTVSRRSL